MSHKDASILVVDDARFSSAIIAKALRSGGFKNVRFTNNPLQALRSLEKMPAQILIADWLMPTMNGLDLTRKVKKLDEANDRFTYVILLSARDDTEDMVKALSIGADDFLNKANIRSLLLERILIAEKIVTREIELLQANKLLRRKIRDLTTTDIVDPVTGLGNLKFTLKQIESATSQADSRGGAACLLLVGINNLDVIRQQYSETAIDELITGISSKLRHLVRPLDVLTRPEANMFAVTMLQPDMQQFSSRSFRRVFDNLYMHSFKTSEGFIPVVVGVSLSAADSETGLPGAKQFMQFAYDSLLQSYESGIISVSRYHTNESHPTTITPETIHTHSDQLKH
ncbi:MAG: response regulator [Pseudomonadales bacterium]|nr:response regulator [Pseudomonadales bacterium]